MCDVDFVIIIMEVLVGEEVGGVVVVGGDGGIDVKFMVVRGGSDVSGMRSVVFLLREVFVVI